MSSLSDETPEGRSIVVLAKTKYGLRGRNVEEIRAKFVPFSARTRMSGVDLDGREIRKGAVDAMENYVREHRGIFPRALKEEVDRVSNLGGTPLVVAEGKRPLGGIYLKDIVKGGIRERFAQLRQMGIKTVMITGDNPRTAAAISPVAVRRFNAMFQSVLRSGCYLPPSAYEVLFLSAAHTGKDVDRTIAAAHEAMREVDE